MNSEIGFSEHDELERIEEKDLFTPTLCFRVAVTGHREERISDSIKDATYNSVKKVLGVIENAVTEAHSKSKRYYSNDEARLRLHSSLAEGADRIVASAALDIGWEVQAALPFSIESYEKDFASDLSKEEFHHLLSRSSIITELDHSRNDADSAGYMAVGELMVRNCDMLVTLWDGEPARGNGGTAHVVELALAQGVPVVWVHLDDPSRIFFIAPTNGQLKVINDGTWEECIFNHLSDCVQPPEVQGFNSASEKRLLRFMSEQSKRINFGIVEPVFRFLTSGRKVRVTDIIPKDFNNTKDELWSDYLKDLEGDDTDTSPAESIHYHLVRADLLANYYAQVYRSAWIFNYVGAAFAVLMALLGLLVKEWKLLWVVVEVVIISSVILNTWYGRRSQWHDRWLEYRSLAEDLRTLRNYSLLGAASLKHIRLYSTLGRLEYPSWMAWYTSAVVRNVDLPAKPISDNVINSYRRLVVMQTTKQIDYHQRTAMSAHKIDHRLHLSGEIFLYMTITVCLVFIVTNFFTDNISDQHKVLVTFLTALFPAFGASLYGMRAHGDFSGVEERSNNIAKHLTSMIEWLENGETTYSFLLAQLDAIREVKGAELRDWRVTFERKQLAVPA